MIKRMALKFINYPRSDAERTLNLLLTCLTLLFALGVAAASCDAESRRQRAERRVQHELLEVP